MEIVASLKPNNAQREFLDDKTSKFLHLSMGFGGGKTFALCYKALELSWLNKDMHGGLVVPDYQEFRKDVLPEMESILEQNNIPYKYHGAGHYFQFPWTNGKLYVTTAEKKIRGPNWAYAVINEVTLIPLIRYKEVIGRVRVKGAACPQIASVGTPEGFASEYYEYFIESPPIGLRIIYGSTDDNKENLHDNYLTNLENAYDSKMIDAYRKGLWVNMNGNQFYYSYNPAKQHDRNLKPDMFSEYLIFLDYNVDPFCASIWGYDGWKIYGVGEIVLEGENGYDTKNMITAMQSRGYSPSNTIIYPDPSGNQRSTKGQPDNKVIAAAGYHVEARRKAPSFRQRQLNVNNLLDKSRIVFNPDLMPRTRKDFEAVEQDKLTLEKVKTNTKLTHLSDGVDYGCDILFPFSGNAKATIESRIR